MGGGEVRLGDAPFPLYPQKRTLILNLRELPGGGAGAKLMAAHARMALRKFCGKFLNTTTKQNQALALT
jgi:hypothetical protein